MGTEPICNISQLSAGERETMYRCLVCGFDELRRPPRDHTICPSCGTQFGLTDAGPEPLPEIHAALRQRWIDRGPRWSSRVIAAPPHWNPWNQIVNANLPANITWLEHLSVAVKTTDEKVTVYALSNGRPFTLQTA